MNFKDATNEIKSHFAKRRISTFAKRNNVSIDEIEVIDDEPIETLEKEFKRSCGIRTRLYKNLTEEQQKAWLSYYNDHKKLSLKVKEKQNNETVLNDDSNNEMILDKSPVSHKKSEKQEKVVKKRNTNKSRTINQESIMATNDSKPTETIEQKSERKHHKRKSKNTNSD